MTLNRKPFFRPDGEVVGIATWKDLFDTSVALLVKDAEKKVVSVINW